MIRHLLFASVFMMGGMVTLAPATSAETVTSRTLHKNDAPVVCQRNVKINFDQLLKPVALQSSVRDNDCSSLKSAGVSYKASGAANNNILLHDNKIAQANGVAIVAYPLYRYYNGTSGDHFYTTDFKELNCGSGGYVFEAIQGHIFRTQYSGSVPLYRYWNATIGDHFYTTDFNELGYGKNGYVFEAIQGYIYPSAYSGTVPLYRYWNATIGDHFYTTNFNELGYGKNGYAYERIEGYIYPTQ